METLINQREVGPLQGFRSKMGRLFNANIKLTEDFETKFDFGNDMEELSFIDFSGQPALGKCPLCQNAVYEHGMFYVCEKAVGSSRTCSFKMSKIILERPIEPDQVVKLLEKGKTDLLSKFISKKGRPFSAYLIRNADGKIGFEFEQKKTKKETEVNVADTTGAKNKQVKSKPTSKKAETAK